MIMLAMAKLPAKFAGWFPFMQGLTPGISVAVILGFFIFAAGFVMTLISTLKAQWGHKSGEGKFIGSGIALLVISFLVIGISSGIC